MPPGPNVAGSVNFGVCYAVITIAIRLRSDNDVSYAPASIRRDSTRAKNEHVNFCRSRIVVESQL